MKSFSYFIIAILLSYITISAKLKQAICFPGFCTLEEEFQNAQILFIGKFVNFTQVDEYNINMEFCVERIWKGEETNKYFIQTCSHELCGGLKFSLGERYLMFGYEMLAQPGIYNTGYTIERVDYNYQNKNFGPALYNFPECT